MVPGKRRKRVVADVKSVSNLPRMRLDAETTFSHESRHEYPRTQASKL